MYEHLLKSCLQIWSYIICSILLLLSFLIDLFYADMIYCVQNNFNSYCVFVITLFSSIINTLPN